MAIDKRILRMMEEDIEKYQQMIAFDPKNAAAHSYLGETYLKLGKYDEAIESFETVIGLLPERSEKEQYKLRTAIEAKARQEVPMIRCNHCRAEILESSRVCSACSQNPRENFLTWLVQKENLKDVLKTTAGCMIVITLLIAFLGTLPIEVLGTLIMSTLIVGFILLYRAF